VPEIAPLIDTELLGKLERLAIFWQKSLPGAVARIHDESADVGVARGLTPKLAQLVHHVRQALEAAGVGRGRWRNLCVRRSHNAVPCLPWMCPHAAANHGGGL